MFEAPLKAVVMTRLKSFLTGEPSENLTSSGMTVHPSRAPVKPAYLENEFTWIIELGQIRVRQQTLWERTGLLSY